MTDPAHPPPAERSEVSANATGVLPRLGCLRRPWPVTALVEPAGSIGYYGTAAIGATSPFALPPAKDRNPPTTVIGSAHGRSDLGRKRPTESLLSPVSRARTVVSNHCPASERVLMEKFSIRR